MDIDFFKLKTQFDCHYGLYRGKMGLSLAAFLKYQATNDVFWKKEAILLLDEVCENIQNIGSINFDQGWLGIGWAIEWIVQNKFVDANTDEILEDLDDELYKAVVFLKAEDLSLENGHVGRGLFLHKRLSAKNPYSLKYRKICNIECLVLVIDAIYENLIVNGQEDEPEINKAIEIKVVAQCLCFLIEVLPSRINNEKVKALLSALIRFVRSAASIENIIDVKYLPLWKSFYYLGKKLNHGGFLIQAQKMINDFKHSSSGRSPSDIRHDSVYSLMYDISKKTNSTNRNDWKEAWLYL